MRGGEHERGGHSSADHRAQQFSAPHSPEPRLLLNGVILGSGKCGWVTQGAGWLRQGRDDVAPPAATHCHLQNFANWLFLPQEFQLPGKAAI